MALFVNKAYSFEPGQAHDIKTPRLLWLEQRRMERIKQRKKLEPRLYLLPHMLTLANAFCGFCAMIFVARRQFEFAAFAILAGACLDGMDGRIARFVGTDGPFGLQLDSLGDAISFCVAPIYLYYFWQFEKLGILGIFLSGLFLCAGLVRLARFNIVVEKKVPYFTGVPTTIAASFLITLFLNKAYVEQCVWFLPLLSLTIVLLSFLMVSPFRFPAYKKMPTKKRIFYFLGVIGIANLILGVPLSKVLLALFMVYFLGAFFI